jgi:hypothetical protein
MLNHNVVWRSTFYQAFIARELADLGHEVTVATISRDRVLRAKTYDLEKVRIVETPDWGVSLARTGWDPWDTFFRCRKFLGETFDLVHGFDCRPVVLTPSLVLARRHGIPWVSDWADCWGGPGGAISQRKSWVGRVAFRPLETWLEEGFRHRARAVTVTSRLLEQRAQDLGCPRARARPAFGSDLALRERQGSGGVPARSRSRRRSTHCMLRRFRAVRPRARDPRLRDREREGP